MSTTQRSADAGGLPGGAMLPPVGMRTLIEAAEAEGTALFAMANRVDRDGEAPEWVTVFPSTGKIKTRDGREYDVPAAELISAFREDGLLLPLDVNHSTDAAALLGAPSPAVGWVVDLRADVDGELKGKVDWLDEGKALLKARQYIYLSPSFYHEAGKATRLKALSLVTAPALARQAALARAGNRAGASVAALAVALGLSREAGEAECLSAISALREGAVPKAEHEAVVARLTALETGNHQASVDALIGDALRAMKIAPAERESYAALCATPAGLEQVRQLFANKAPLMRPSNLDGRPDPAGAVDDENAQALAARAGRYRAAQASAGIELSNADAIRFAHLNPTAGR